MTIQSTFVESPLDLRESPPVAVAGRVAAALVLSASVAVLAIAAWLTPDPRGFGTHEQLGTPPCLPLMRWGLPCPTCGMCTAFAHAIRGELVAAFLAQPAGLALAVATAIAGVASAFVLIAGRKIPLAISWSWTKQLLWIAIVLVLAAWAYKVIMLWSGRIVLAVIVF